MGAKRRGRISSSRPLVLLCHLNPGSQKSVERGMKATRIPHAPSTPLPELAEFLAPFHVHFKRSEGPQTLERYLTGLLTELPNKNCDTIAQVVPSTSEQRLQGLLTTIDWDEDDLNGQRIERLLTLPTEGDGVLIFDDTGFAKQGRCSVGLDFRTLSGRVSWIPAVSGQFQMSP